jgi:hypothetical protein
MISASQRVDSVSALLPESPRGGRVEDAANSFAQQLTTTMANGAVPLHGEVTRSLHTAIVDGRNSVTRQLSAATSQGGGPTWKINSPLTTAPATTTSTTTSTSTSATGTVGGTPASEIPTMLGMGPLPGATPVQVPTGVDTPAPAAEMTEADAYWASQPAAVQVLRDMPYGPDKEALASSLEQQGYAIDTQIMVWGWDPQMTMVSREAYGYTWVPSWGQPSINEAPGVTDPFVVSNYNPSDPPPGSIIVSTAFANGTIQNPIVAAAEQAATNS